MYRLLRDQINAGPIDSVTALHTSRRTQSPSKTDSLREGDMADTISLSRSAHAQSKQKGSKQGKAEVTKLFAEVKQKVRPPPYYSVSTSTLSTTPY